MDEESVLQMLKNRWASLTGNIGEAYGRVMGDKSPSDFKGYNAPVTSFLDTRISERGKRPKSPPINVPNVADALRQARRDLINNTAAIGDNVNAGLDNVMNAMPSMPQRNPVAAAAEPPPPPAPAVGNPDPSPMKWGPGMIEATRMQAYGPQGTFGRMKADIPELADVARVQDIRQEKAAMDAVKPTPEQVLGPRVQSEAVAGQLAGNNQLLDLQRRKLADLLRQNEATKGRMKASADNANMTIQQLMAKKRLDEYQQLHNPGIKMGGIPTVNQFDQEWNDRAPIREALAAKAQQRSMDVASGKIVPKKRVGDEQYQADELKRRVLQHAQKMNFASPEDRAAWVEKRLSGTAQDMAGIEKQYKREKAIKTNFMAGNLSPQAQQRYADLGIIPDMAALRAQRYAMINRSRQALPRRTNIDAVADVGGRAMAQQAILADIRAKLAQAGLADGGE